MHRVSVRVERRVVRVDQHAGHRRLVHFGAEHEIGLVVAVLAVVVVQSRLVADVREIRVARAVIDNAVGLYRLCRLSLLSETICRLQHRILESRVIQGWCNRGCRHCR